MASTEWDRKYIQSLITNVLQSVVDSQDGLLKLGDLEIPIPPSDIRKCIICLFTDLSSKLDSK